MSPPADVTALLLAWNRGDEDARSALMTAVYAELRRMAARRLRSEAMLAATRLHRGCSSTRPLKPANRRASGGRAARSSSLWRTHRCAVSCVDHAPHAWRKPGPAAARWRSFASSAAFQWRKTAGGPERLIAATVTARLGVRPRLAVPRAARHHPMSTESRWARVEAIFAGGAGAPLVERPAFLDEACSGDAALREDIEGLLQSHDEAGTFLERPASPSSLGGHR